MEEKSVEDKRIKRDNYVSPIAYTAEEKAVIVKRFNQLDVADLSIEQAYYYILDNDKNYIGSLSIVYRVLKANNMVKDRRPCKASQKRKKTTAFNATGINQV